MIKKYIDWSAIKLSASVHQKIAIKKKYKLNTSVGKGIGGVYIQ